MWTSRSSATYWRSVTSAVWFCAGYPKCTGKTGLREALCRPNESSTRRPVLYVVGILAWFLPDVTQGTCLWICLGSGLMGFCAGLSAQFLNGGAVRCARGRGDETLWGTDTYWCISGCVDGCGGRCWMLASWVTRGRDEATYAVLRTKNRGSSKDRGMMTGDDAVLSCHEYRLWWMIYVNRWMMMTLYPVDGRRRRNDFAYYFFLYK